MNGQCLVCGQAFEGNRMQAAAHLAAEHPDEWSMAVSVAAIQTVGTTEIFELDKREEKE